LIWLGRAGRSITFVQVELLLKIGLSVLGSGQSRQWNSELFAARTAHGERGVLERHIRHTKNTFAFSLSPMATIL